MSKALSVDLASGWCGRLRRGSRAGLRRCGSGSARRAPSAGAPAVGGGLGGAGGAGRRPPLGPHGSARGAELELVARTPDLALAELRAVLAKSGVVVGRTACGVCSTGTG